MMHKRHDSWLNEFTVFGVFVVVAFVGFLYLGATLLFGQNAVSQIAGAEAVTAPTDDAYRAQVRQTMAPFLDAAGKLTVADITGVKEDLLIIVKTTQDRLIAVRVPAEERDAHLALVLLMEHWKRALAGSDENEQDAVFQSTQDFIAAHPWIAP